MKKIITIKTKEGVIIVNPLHVSHIERRDENPSFVWLGETNIPVTKDDCDAFIEQFNSIMA